MNGKDSLDGLDGLDGMDDPDKLDDRQGTDEPGPEAGEPTDRAKGSREHERFHKVLGEKLVPEILRRGIESGLDSFMRSDRGVRKAITDLRLKREVTNYVFGQIDDTKNAALRIIAGEVRDFLENTNLEGALRSVLTSLAFEIHTDVRFVPLEDGSIRPKVKSTARPVSTRGGSAGGGKGRSRTAAKAGVRRRRKTGS